jgi:hypothetical protein
LLSVKWCRAITDYSRTITSRAFSARGQAILDIQISISCVSIIIPQSLVYDEMAMIQAKTRESSQTQQPFPHHLIDEIITKTPTHRSPPDFGFPSYPVIPIARNLSPGPTHLPEIMTPITPLDHPIPATSKGPTLLTIPLEIRFQIYHYVLLSYPIRHAHLVPINDAERKEEFHTSMLKPNGLNFPTAFPSQLLTTSSPSLPASPSASNGQSFSEVRRCRSALIQGKIPTGLLSSCKQIHAETRHLPFHTSTFIFVNWFWSGVYAARQFSRSLRPWQSSSIRYVSVEVLGRDIWVGGMARIGGAIGGAATSTLVNSGVGRVTSTGFGGKEGKGVGEWRELCELWEGVWGLRLGIKGSVVLDGRKAADVEVDGERGWNGEGGKWSAPSNTDSEFSEEKKKHQERGILNVQMEWVINGLLSMKSLRWIELEIEDEDVDRGVKLEFCAELETTLSELRNRDDGWTDGVQVVFVERIPEQQKEEKYYVGEPGDEEVWGLGS